MSQKNGEKPKTKAKAQGAPAEPYPEPGEYLKFEARETYQRRKESKITGESKSESDQKAVEE